MIPRKSIWGREIVCPYYTTSATALLVAAPEEFQPQRGQYGAGEKGPHAAQRLSPRHTPGNEQYRVCTPAGCQDLRAAAATPPGWKCFFRRMNAGVVRLRRTRPSANSWHASGVRIADTSVDACVTNGRHKRDACATTALNTTRRDWEHPRVRTHRPCRSNRHRRPRRFHMTSRKSWSRSQGHGIHHSTTS
jgi:hypothetical protein